MAAFRLSPSYLPALRICIAEPHAVEQDPSVGCNRRQLLLAVPARYPSIVTRIEFRQPAQGHVN